MIIKPVHSTGGKHDIMSFSIMPLHKFKSTHYPTLHKPLLALHSDTHDDVQGVCCITCTFPYALFLAVKSRVRERKKKKR